MEAFHYIFGDTLPRFDMELQEDDGTPISLALYTSIKLRIRPEDGSAIIEKDHEPDGDPSEGAFHFSWSSEELPVGRHRAEVRLVDTSGDPLTFRSNTGDPFLIIVSEAL